MFQHAYLLAGWELAVAAVALYLPRRLGTCTGERLVY
jgi:hypothetical protein